MARASVFFVFVAYIILTIVSANDTVNNSTPRNPVVSTFLGRIKGSYMTTRLGKRIFAFRGMRFAESPTGERRFKVAVPVKSWNDIFDASEEGPACPGPQGQLLNEDCLRLNVYTTKLPVNTSSYNARLEKKRPVLVWFHPGAFFGYSGQSYLFGPQYLLDQDIVLVTVNYRIGALGFLAMGDALAPGNLGLKDQVVALRWVKEHIAAFGGDPNSVTISGYSAGGWSVAFHMMSPMSKGLFHRAISMSGSPMNGEPLRYEQINYAKKQARLLNCPDDSSSKIIACLKTKSSQEMANTFSNLTEWNGLPVLIWSPVVEPDIPGVERFLIGQPADLIRQGKIHQVPFMTGLTRDEFGYISMQPIVQARHGDDSIFRDLNANWSHIAPIVLQYERNTAQSARISHGLREYYFKGKSIGLNNSGGLANVVADAIVGYPEHLLVNLVASVSKQPVYYYRFMYQGRYSHANWPDTMKPYGIVHHDDFMYLFYVSFLPYFEKDAPEIFMVERMTAMWANFAKTGNPIPKNNKAFEGVTWERFTPQNKRYMEINSTLAMKTGLNLERMQTWERLIPLHPMQCYDRLHDTA